MIYTTYKNGDDCGMVYGIASTTFYDIDMYGLMRHSWDVNLILMVSNISNELMNRIYEWNIYTGHIHS